MSARSQALVPLSTEPVSYTHLDVYKRQFWNPLPAPGPYCGRFGIPRRRPCVMRWRLTAGWSGICGKILTVSGYLSLIHISSLIQTAEQALWKREWAAWDHGLAVPECVTRGQAVVNQVRRDVYKRQI